MHADSLILTIPLLLLAWSAAGWDLKQRRIPNLLVLAGILAGATVQLAVAGVGGFLNGLSGLLVGMVVFMPGFLLGFTGAADVKLMGAAGVFLGPYAVFIAALISLVVGGLIAIGFMMAPAFVDRAGTAPWQRYGLMVRTLFSTGRPIYLAPQSGEVMGRRFPFAVSIAIATTATLSLV